MKQIGRLFRWTLFIGFCAAAATVTFHYVRQQPRSKLQGQHYIVHLSADGSRLVTGTMASQPSQRLEVWDTHSGRLLHTLLTDVTRGTRAIAPGGNPMVVAAGDGMLHIVDWQNGEESTLPLGLTQEVTFLQFSPKGRWLMARLPFAAEDVYIDMQERKVAQRRPDTFVAFMADEKHAAVRNHQDWEEPLRLFCLDTGEHRGHLGEAFSETTVDPSGKFVALANVHRPPNADSFLTVEVWDLSSGQRRFKHRLDAGSLDRMEFSRGGGLLAVPCGAAARTGVRRTHVFDTESGQVVLVGPERLPIVESAVGPLLVVRDDNRFRVLDAQGVELWRRPREPNERNFFGSVIISRAPESGHVDLLDLLSGRVVARHPFESTLSVSATFTPDGRHVLLRGGPFDRIPPSKRLPAPPPPAPPPIWKEWLQRWAPWLVPPPKEWAVAVVETTTGRELFRMRLSDWHQYQLSEDGSTLVGTMRGDPRAPVPAPAPPIIHVWDVHPGRAWLWAVLSGLSAAIGIVVLGWCWRWIRGDAQGRDPS